MALFVYYICVCVAKIECLFEPTDSWHGLVVKIKVSTNIYLCVCSSLFGQLLVIGTTRHPLHPPILKVMVWMPTVCLEMDCVSHPSSSRLSQINGARSALFTAHWMPGLRSVEQGLWSELRSCSLTLAEISSLSQLSYRDQILHREIEGKAVDMNVGYSLVLTM